MTIIETELNDSVSQAVTSTQIAMREQIEDRLYNTHNARTKFETSEDYYNYFINTLKETKTNKNVKYDVNIYAADVEKGLLSVEVTAYYKRLDGTIIPAAQAPKCKKISIVDIIMD